MEGLVGLRLEAFRFLPVDREAGQDLERGALAGARADFLKIEAAGAQQLFRDAVLRLLRAAEARGFVFPFAELVEDLAGERRSAEARGAASCALRAAASATPCAIFMLPFWAAMAMARSKAALKLSLPSAFSI